MLLKRKAEADKETVGLQRGVVALVEVEQAKTVSAKQVEVGELHIGTEHSIQVEAATGAVVAVPIRTVFAKDGVNALGGTRCSPKLQG